MRRRSVIAGLGSLAAGSLAGCLGRLTGSTVEEPFDASYGVSQGTTVAIGNRNGPVTVQRADGDELTVSGTKRAGSRDGLDSIDVEVVEGGRFSVNVRFERGSDFSNRSVDLTVEIPETASVGRVNTANGDVTVSGVAGDLDATTTNGDVEVTDVDGFVGAETTNGSVRVRNATGLTGARTSNGDVDVDVLAMRGDVDCRSSNGNVTARAGPGLSVAFELTTNTGTARVRDLQHTTTTNRDGYVEGNLRGGNSPLLFLRTGNGDVTLRPA